MTHVRVPGLQPPLELSAAQESGAGVSADTVERAKGWSAQAAVETLAPLDLDRLPKPLAALLIQLGRRS